MRTSYLVAVSLLAVVFAGCTDEPPSAEFSSSGHAISIAGSIESLETQQYSTPAPEGTPPAQQCVGDQIPDPVPAEDYQCEYPYTKMVVNFTGLPDPSGKTYSIKFYSDATGTMEDIGALDGVHEMGGAWMGNYAFDNEADCDGQQGDDGNAACDKTVNFDSVHLYLDDIPVASAGLTSGAAFEVLSSLTGGSFTGSYDGKDFVITTSGLSANLTYQAWLITEDEAGAPVHAESFSVSASGESTFTAEMNGDKYVGVHIHVTGTKLNVGVASL